MTSVEAFVIPLGRDRYELYCEHPTDVSEGEPQTPARGVVAKLRQRFSEVLREAELRRHSGAPVEAEGFVARWKEKGMAWVAERVAEQRLLWNLRGETDAVASHPEDMSFPEVLTLIRRVLQRDYDRHRRWLVIDGIAFLATFILLGPLFLLIPGVANLPAAYFAFRTVGHFLSMRGAAHGLRHVTWTGRPCPPLTELRAVPSLDPVERDVRLQDIGARLRLQHLASFFERVAVSHA